MSRSKNSVVIELCGLPGAGKTTFAKRCAQELGAEIIAGRTGRIEMLCAPLFAPVPFMRWALWLLLETVATRTYGLLRYKVALLCNTFALCRRAARSKAQLLVIEEGLLQRFVSISERPVSVEWARRFLRTTMPGRHVVFVELCEPSFRRYVEGHARYDRGAQYLAAWKEVAQMNYEAIKAATAALGAQQTTLRGEEDVRAFMAHYRPMGHDL